MMTRRTFWRLLQSALIGTIAFNLGCQHVPPPPALEGKASFRFVDPPAPSPLMRNGTIQVEQSREIFTPAEAILPLAVPVYPRVALGVTGFGVSVPVHVSVDS